MSVNIMKKYPKYQIPANSINKNYIISIIDLVDSVVTAQIQDSYSKVKETLIKKWIILK
jgi:hypothetical protein